MAMPTRRSINVSAVWLATKRWLSSAEAVPLAKTKGQYKALRSLKPDSPPDSRVLKVALMGMSNAGKSTLMNALMGRRVSSVSKTFHTTQRNTIALMIEDATQVVFLDTPGIFGDTSAAKRDVDRRLRTDPFTAVEQADIVAVLVDAGNVWTRSSLHQDIVNALEKHRQKPSILILNKVDLVGSKTELLTLTRTLTSGVVGGVASTDLTLGLLRRRWHRQQKDSVYLEELFARYDARKSAAQPMSVMSARLPSGTHTMSGRDGGDGAGGGSGSAAAKPGCWQHFRRVFMVSSLESDGVADLRHFLCQQARPGAWLYHSSFVTDQQPDEILELCLREAFLEHLPQEIPFRLETEVAEWEEKEGMLKISVHVLCRNKGTFSITMGKNGSTLRAIAVKAEQDLAATFGCPVVLRLMLKSPASAR